MEQFLKEKLEFDDVFDRLMHMQKYLEDIKKLEVLNLPQPVCLQNAYKMNMFYIKEKWSDSFPSLQTIEEYIRNEKKLFYLPNDSYYYFLYYHLMIACKKYLGSANDKKIYDAEKDLDYEIVNNYLIEKNLDATKFFEIYLEKGLPLDEADLSYALHDESNEKIDEISDKLDEVIVREMSSEPTAPMLETEKIETELPVTTSVNIEFEEEEEKKILVEDEDYY